MCKEEEPQAATDDTAEGKAAPKASGKKVSVLKHWQVNVSVSGSYEQIASTESNIFEFRVQFPSARN